MGKTNNIKITAEMAARANIFATVLVFCSILPLLASQFVPEGSPEDDSGSSMQQWHGGFPIFVALFGSKDHTNAFGSEKSAKWKEEQPPKVPTSAANEQKPAEDKEKKGTKEVAEQGKYVQIPEQVEGSGEFVQIPEQVEGLRVKFYERSCPQAEQIVKDIMFKANQNDSGLAAAVVRLHSHDCFVQGCDASVLLDKDPTGQPVEKAAGPNGEFIQGIEVIDEIKAELEKECPGVVACVDILTYAARDALILSGLPSYDVAGGHKDGLSSLEKNVLPNVPISDHTMDSIIDLFGRKGLNVEKLVVLTGSHSIGVSHCGNFNCRVDNPIKVKEIDPRLTAVIRFQCADPKNSLPFDSVTQYKMDSIYYKHLLKNKGLIESDQFMANDPKTRGFMEKFANDENGWFEKFAAAMVKM